MQLAQCFCPSFKEAGDVLQLTLTPAQLCHIIGEAPQGGQILIDANCYADISNSLASIAGKVAPKPDLETLASLQK